MEKELYDIKLSDLIASYPDINDPNFTKDIYRKKEFLDLNFITTIELSKKDSLSFYWENKFHPILKYDLESNYGIDTPDSLKAFIAQNIITKKDINNKSEAIVIDNKIKELSSKIFVTSSSFNNF